MGVATNATRATVSWNPPADQGSSPVTAYRVIANPGERTCITTTTSCTVDGLEPGTAYTFTVVALNDVDWGTPSSASDPVTVVAPVIEIAAGPRTKEGRRDRVVITGVASGLAPGTVLTPYLRLGNGRAEAMGRARVVVGTDGAIAWKRQVRFFRTITVYLKAEDWRSNAVSWSRIR